MTASSESVMSCGNECDSCGKPLALFHPFTYCSRCMPRKQPDASVITGLSIEATCMCGERYEQELPTGQIRVHEDDVDLDLSWFCSECGRLNERSPLLLNDDIQIDRDTPHLVLCNGRMEIVSVEFAE